MTAAHEQVRDLVAAYAVDAVDPDESRAVEDHLRGCPRCRAELTAHRQTASLLAHAGGDAPSGVWDQIAAGIQPGAAPPALSVVVGGSGRARPVPGRRLAGAAAAAVFALVAGLGVAAVQQNQRLDRMTAALADQQTLARATAAAIDPRADRVALSAWNGTARATAALLPDGTGYLLPGSLAALPGRRTYQLWSIAGGHPVSAGLLGAVPRVLAFHLAPGATALAITDEPAGGSRQPTVAPLASARI